MDELSNVLSNVASAAGAAAPILPGIAGVVAGIAASALGLAADLAKGGNDPKKAIERIRKIAPELNAVEESWDEKIRQRFGEV